MIYKLCFFLKSKDGICANDFERSEEFVTINTNFILSLSDLKSFNLPFTGKYVGEYALLTMSNGDKYYMDRDSFLELSDTLSQKQT